METKQAKYRIKNQSGVYDTVYFETIADMVFFGDGETLQEKLDTGDLGGVPENVKTIAQSSRPIGQYQGRVWLQLIEGTISEPSIVTGDFLSGEALCGEDPIGAMKRKEGK